MVDPSGDHARHCRSGAHDPHSRPHGRDDQQAHSRFPPAPAAARQGAGARGDRRGHGDQRGARARDHEDRAGAGVFGNADRRGGGFPPRRLHRGPGRSRAGGSGFVHAPEGAARRSARHLDGARGARAAPALRLGRRQGAHAGRSRTELRRDARTHPPDRGEGSPEAAASEPQPQAQGLSRLTGDFRE